MAKAKAVSASVKEVEINRWAIEMAMRWPVHSQPSYGNGGYSSSGGYVPGVHKDEDVIGRAEKIIAWVKTRH